VQGARENIRGPPGNAKLKNKDGQSWRGVDRGTWVKKMVVLGPKMKEGRGKGSGSKGSRRNPEWRERSDLLVLEIGEGRGLDVA